MYDTRTMVDNSDHLHSYLKSYVEEYHHLRTTEKLLLQHVANDEFDSFQEVIRRAHKKININAHNMWNQTSLILAIRNGNSDFVEYLLEQHQQNMLLGEALPFAIHLNKIQIVEILLKFIERTDCEPYTLNYRSKYCDQSMMVIAARNNNYDMIYLLFKYGFPPIEQPEELTYECTLEEVTQIYHTYDALSSMSYICITENDPILRAFMLTDKLNEIAASKYCVAKDLYEELSGRVSKIPGKLMSLCHNNEEVRCLLNTDLGFPKDASGNTMIYPRAMLAVAYGQKEFVADDKCQRFLSDCWVSDKVYKKSMTFLKQVQQIIARVLMLPVISCVLWFAPHSKLASRWTSPVEQFLNHNSSYIMFLVVLFLHSDNKRIHYIPGSGLLLIIYVQSLAILEYKTYRHMGSELYFRQRWKIFNIGMIILFDIAFLFWGYNHYISRHSLLDRKFLTSYDPVMIAEVIYAIATLMSWWKLMYFVQIYRKMGPLTVSLSSIAGKSAATYITIYIILMMGFASCMFTLYTPYTDEVRYFAGKVHEHPEHFISMVSSIKSCYWATFGYGPPEFADLVTSEYYDVKNNHVIAKVNKHGFTEGVGYIVFALVNVVMTTLMSNLLMAVIAKDLDDVDENAVLEWKFARTQVWISYFGKHPMIPPPFNVFPTFTDIKWALGAIKGAMKISTSTIPQMSEEKRCLLRRNRRNYQKLMAVLTLRYYKHVEYIERPSKEHY